MGWIAALVTIPAIAMLGVTFWRMEGDKGWRDQAEGLRERLEQEGLPRWPPTTGSRWRAAERADG